MSGNADQTYYPSCVVNFRLRLDEALQVQTVPTLPAPLPQDGILGAITRTFVNVASVRPLVTQKGKDNLSFVNNRVPRSGTVELPAYRQAGKFSFEIDWRELPIDPRLLRSVGVEVYFGTVSAADFASGMVRVDPKLGVRRSILNTKYPDGTPRNDLMALAGLVDVWHVQHSESGSTVKIEGRDLRGIFLDSPINPAVIGKINLNRPVTEVVADILRTHPAGQYMQVLYAPDDWPTGAPASVADAEGLTRVRQGADGKGGQGGQISSDKPNYWDLITKYCFLVGSIPFFRGHDLVIRPARSVFDQSKPAGQSPNATVIALDTATGLASSAPPRTMWDPMIGGDGFRVDDQGNRFFVRKFIYGRNLKELSFDRKFAGVKVPTVQVLSYDSSSTKRGAGKLLVAEWPPASDPVARTTGVSPSGEIAQTDKIVKEVPGIRDLSRLTAIARSIYEEVGRGEMGGTASTGALASFKGDNSDPDVLRLRPGHAIELLMDNRRLQTLAPAASTVLADERASFDEAVQQIKRTLGGDDNLARALVASARGSVIDQLRTFRTANVKFTWSMTAGIQMAFDFQNYVVARHGVSAQTGANQAPPVRVSAARADRTAPPVGALPQPSTQPVTHPTSQPAVPLPDSFGIPAVDEAALQRENDQRGGLEVLFSRVPGLPF